MPNIGLELTIPRLYQLSQVGIPSLYAFDQSQFHHQSCAAFLCLHWSSLGQAIIMAHSQITTYFST